MEEALINQRAAEFEEAIRLLRRLKFTATRESDLKNSERFFLLSIAEIGGEKVTPSDIAKRIGVTLAAITHHINSLEENGYVERSSSTDDRRIVYVVLTKKGVEVVQDIKTKISDKVSSLIEFLGETDSAKLIDLIQKIASFLSLNENKNKGNNA